MTRPAIVAQLRMLGATLGRTPRCRDVDQADRADIACLNAIIRAFGSWRQALIAAGYNPSTLHDRCFKGLHAMAGENIRHFRRADGTIGRRCRRCSRDSTALAYRAQKLAVLQRRRVAA